MGPWVQVSIDQPLDPDIEHTLGTDQYIFRDYVDSRGEPGYFQFDYFVYDRAGAPCRTCGTVIVGTRHGQRASRSSDAPRYEAYGARCLRRLFFLAWPRCLGIPRTRITRRRFSG